VTKGNSREKKKREEKRREGKRRVSALKK